jgi:hypothetical protein
MLRAVSSNGRLTASRHMHRVVFEYEGEMKDDGGATVSMNESVKFRNGKVLFKCKNW